jgi:hypothetical protein
VAVDPGVSRELFETEVAEMRTWARFNGGGWVLVSAEYPRLIVELPHRSGARRQFVLHCDNWDEQPPSVKPLDAQGNVVSGVPAGGLFAGLNSGWGLCAVGTREYHGHHTDNPWSAHRSAYTLQKIVGRLGFFYGRTTG